MIYNVRKKMLLPAMLLLARTTMAIVPLGILREIHDYYTGFPPLPAGLLDDEGRVNAAYDFVVIGAGSGGSVLANRLTEVPHWRVLVLEAGKDEMFLTDIPLLAPAMQITAYNWGYRSERARRRDDFADDEAGNGGGSSSGGGGYCLAMVEGRCNWPRGRAVGGTSVINYMIHARGSRADYDRWAALGNPGWSYDDVLPYFRKSENVHIGNEVRGVSRSSEHRGKGGYLDVTTSPYVSPLREPFLEAGEELGHTVGDCNAEDVAGFCVAQANLRGGRRVSASKAFLRPVKHRTNLHLSKHSRVTRIVVDPVARRAVGVEFLKDGRRYFVKATKEVLLSAGTLNSPQLLMLSGIGPRDHLEELGIRAIEDLPVGRNLQDHTSMGALTFLVNDSVTIVEPRLVSNPANTLDYLTAGTGPLTVPGGAECLAFVNTRVKTPAKKETPIKRSFDQVPANTPNTLTDPGVPNQRDRQNSTDRIDATTNARYADDEPDIELVLGLGALTGDISGLVRNMFGLTDEWYAEMFRGYEGLDAFSIVPVLLHPQSRGRVTLRSRNPLHWPIFEANYYDDEEDLKTMIRGIRKAVEVASTRAFRRFNATLLPSRFPGCADLKFDTDEYWACGARHASTTLGHFVGTCKMGAREDDGVVDATLKVHGIQGLRVVDASVMPLLISGHTNAPTYMIGEKASDMIKDEWLLPATEAAS